MSAQEQKHTLSVLVWNRPGVLARTSSMFARRGFNIYSLAVCATEKPEISRMTVVVAGDQTVLEQIIKQLNKLIDAIRVIDHTDHDLVTREVALIKLNTSHQTRKAHMELAGLYNGTIATINPQEETMIVELLGTADRIDAYLEDLEQLAPNSIKELVRTGRVALVKGSRDT